MDKSRRLLKPCDRCRSQHLKCIYTSERCQRCERAGSQCVRSRKTLRFRDVPASRFHHSRTYSNGSTKPTSETHDASSDQTSQQSRYIFEAANTEGSSPVMSSEADFVEHETDDHQPRVAFNTASEAGHDRHTNPGGSKADFTRTGIPNPDGFREGTDSSTNRSSPRLMTSPDHMILANVPRNMDLATKSSISEHSSVVASHTSPYAWMTQTPVNDYLDGLVKMKAHKQLRPHDYVESILLRYFHDELAPWFDLCDPDCHFATVVLQKARNPGPLRNALLTISARNLARNKRFRDDTGVVRWHDHTLPALTEEFAVPYHSECIRDLLQLSMDSKNLLDETLLAAVIALRADEEMGHSVHEEGEDQQLFLKIASVFIDAQVPPVIALPHSSPTVFLSAGNDATSQQGGSTHASPVASSVGISPSDTRDPDLGTNGLRQACFWTAFRQELHAAFLKQQPVRFPLARCEAFRQLSPTIDAIWANRMVTFCADVLEFCYGSESSDGKVPPAYTSKDRWNELRSRERRICMLLPASFEPTYCSEPRTSLDSLFPEIWYLDPCHVSGTTYIELARMLLEVFNPTRPQLGHGFLAATTAFIHSTKKILFRLCGIALSNRHCPPSLINACIGISIFGEYFGDAGEQDALLKILGLMTDHYAYPTRQIALSLKRAWKRDDIALDTQSLPASGNHVHM